ncbi:hypothetical protein CHUAL_006496 [Chamberlinius hualienensis]
MKGKNKMFSWGLYFAVNLAVLTIGMAKTLNKPNCIDDYYTEAITALNGINNCTYPRTKINPECVGRSYPQLKNLSLCPTLTNESVSRENVETTIQMVNEYLKQKTICEVPLNIIPFPKTTFIADQLLKGTPFTGSCTINGRTTTINNVNNTVIRINSFPPLVVDVNVDNLVYNGTMDCRLGFKFFGQIFYFPFDNIQFNEPMNVSVVANISLGDNRTLPTILSVNVTSKSQYSMATLDKIVAAFKLRETLEKWITIFIEISTIPESFAKFVLNILFNTFQITKQQCK